MYPPFPQLNNLRDIASIVLWVVLKIMGPSWVVDYIAVTFKVTKIGPEFWGATHANPSPLLKVKPDEALKAAREAVVPGLLRDHRF